MSQLTHNFSSILGQCRKRLHEAHLSPHHCAISSAAAPGLRGRGAPQPTPCLRRLTSCPQSSPQFTLAHAGQACVGGAFCVTWVV